LAGDRQSRWLRPRLHGELPKASVFEQGKGSEYVVRPQAPDHGFIGPGRVAG